MRSPKVGDYVITQKLIGYGKYDDQYNLGQIVKIRNDQFYYVKIDSEKEDVKEDGDVTLKLASIYLWSEDLEELKTIIDTNKYNL